MSNQPITDMIETIERYAQLQPDYPVYNVLGEGAYLWPIEG